WGCERDKLSPVRNRLQAPPLDFGQVELGERRSGMLELFNPGLAELRVSRIDAAAPFQGAELHPVLRIPGGQSRKVALGFAPDAEGPQNQLATVVSDADAVGAVSLHGFGAHVSVTLAPRLL